MRCHRFEEGKRCFDFTAIGILLDVENGGLTVAQTRAEVSRRFPVAKLAKDALWKIKRIIDSVTDDEQRVELLKALSEDVANRCKKITRPPPPSGSTTTTTFLIRSHRRADFCQSTEKSARRGCFNSKIGAHRDAGILRQCKKYP